MAVNDILAAVLTQLRENGATPAQEQAVREVVERAAAISGPIFPGLVAVGPPTFDSPLIAFGAEVWSSGACRVTAVRRITTRPAVNQYDRGDYRWSSPVVVAAIDA